MKTLFLRLPVMVYMIPFMYLNQYLHLNGVFSEDFTFGMGIVIFAVLFCIQSVVFLDKGKNASIEYLLRDKGE